MKRFAAAGIFALIGGGATLVLVASILQSCHQGGHPHDMGTDPEPTENHHSNAAVVDHPVSPSVAAASLPATRKVTIPSA